MNQKSIYAVHPRLARSEMDDLLSLVKETTDSLLQEYDEDDLVVLEKLLTWLTTVNPQYLLSPVIMTEATEWMTGEVTGEFLMRLHFEVFLRAGVSTPRLMEGLAQNILDAVRIQLDTEDYLVLPSSVTSMTPLKVFSRTQPTTLLEKILSRFNSKSTSYTIFLFLLNNPWVMLLFLLLVAAPITAKQSVE